MIARVFSLLLCLAAACALRAEDDVRFSATITADQRTSVGFDQLSSDNVAVIDGLVRQDLAASKFRNNAVDHTRFVQRRTPHERAIAGLDLLAPAQLDRLDALVQLRIAGPTVEFTETSPAVSSSAANAAVQTVKYERPREIHGQASYTVGWSKAGSFQGGDLVLTYDDPAHRFSVLVGYSEYHGKGLPLCIYPGGAPYRPYLNGLVP